MSSFLFLLQLVSVRHRPGQVQGSGGGGAHALVHPGHAAGQALNWNIKYYVKDWQRFYLNTLYLHTGWLDVVAPLVPQHTGRPHHVHHHHCILLSLTIEFFKLHSRSSPTNLGQQTLQSSLLLQTRYFSMGMLRTSSWGFLARLVGAQAPRGCPDLAEGSDILKI